MLSEIKPYFQRKMLAIFAWAFACGLPLILLTSTLATYLTSIHVSLAIISLFAFATIPYSLKFMTSPLVQFVEVPVFTRYFGRARSWMMVTMFGVMLGLITIAGIIHFHASLILLFSAAIFTVLCSSLTDIAEAEYRIELLTLNEFSHGVACYTVGYRFGMITGASVVLFFAAYASWSLAYCVMVPFILIGIVAIISQPEAKQSATSLPLNLVSIYLYPIRDLLKRPEWLSVLALIILFNYTDNIFNMLLNPFLLQRGFSLTEIGIWQGSVGGVAIMLGSLFSGMLIARFSLAKILLSAAILTALINLTFIPLVFYQSFYLFYFESIVGNFVIGLATTAYITMMAMECRRPYTASQSAILTSVMAGGKMMWVMMSGYVVSVFGWGVLFGVLPLMVVPIGFTVMNYRRRKLGVIG